MSTLPLTVTAVDYIGAELYRVSVAFADGTVDNFIIPASMATVEAVTFAAAAFGTLTDPSRPYVNTHHRHHRRYDPRGG